MKMLAQHQSDIEKKMKSAGMPTDAIVREISFAKQIFDNNTYLQDCDPKTILSAIVNVANVGLTLNPAARESYIVPRYNSQSKQKEAHLMPSYIGLIKLIIQEGGVSSIIAGVVYSNDEIYWEPTNNQQPIRHIPKVFGDRGKIVGVYALATLADGTRQGEVMSVLEVEEIRNNSESYKNEKTRRFSPWVKHFDEMARKTVIRRIFKYLPRGGKNAEALNTAIELDNQDGGAEMWQMSKIENYLYNPSINLPDQELRQWQAEFVGGMTRTRAFEMLSEIESYLPPDDPRYSGGGGVNVSGLTRQIKNAEKTSR